MSEYRILVTGATGVVGSLVVDALERAAAEGRTVDGRRPAAICTTRSAEKAANLEKQGRKAVLLDLDAPASFPAVLEGIDAVFLLTGYTADMCQQTKWFADAAKAAGVKHLVHLGAINPGHDLVEHYIATTMPTAFTHLHPAFFAENVLQYDGRPRIHGGVVSSMLAPDAPMLWISSADTAAVAAVVLLDPQTHIGKTYTLGTQVATCDEACKEFSEALGREIKYSMLDGGAFYEEALKETPQDAGRLLYLKCISTGAKAAAAAYRERQAKGLPGPASTIKVSPDVENLLGRKPMDLRAFALANREAFLK
ncbi:hypothetical protein DFJ74DRAFT_705158 [Hyaloraphidium curvatum]|nr:hypothetical protein DFJ74DRAFT_705158 [Hyaloraphidium curvatum]